MEGFSIEQFYFYGKKDIVKKDSNIYDPSIEYDCHCAFLLDSGICALTNLSKSGKEKIFLYFSGKRVVGFTQLMPITRTLHINSANIFIQAKTDCTVYRITQDVFFNLIRTSSSFCSFMFRVLTENYAEILYRFYQFQDEPASVRLCCLLLEQSYNYNGKLTFPSYFTYEELSKYLGVHPVTIARIMGKLKQYGYIVKVKHHLVLNNPEKLKFLVESRIDLEHSDSNNCFDDIDKGTLS